MIHELFGAKWTLFLLFYVWMGSKSVVLDGCDSVWPTLRLCTSLLTHTHNNTHLTTAFMVISHVLLNSACQLTQWIDLSMISTFLVRFFKRNPSIAVIWIITRICGHRNLHRFLHHLNVQEYQVTQILCMFVYEIFWIIWLCFQLHWSVLKETYFAPFYKM